MNKLPEYTYQEVKAWQFLTRTPLTSWEAETLILLGNHYVNKREQFNNTNDPAPYQAAYQTEDNRKKVVSIFSALG